MLKKAKKRAKRANGEGGITLRSDGRWQGEILVGRDFETGKPKKKTVYGKTKEECATKIRDLGYEMSRDLYIEPNRTLFATWLDTWLRDYKKQKLSPTAYYSYETNIRVHIKLGIGGLALKELNTPLIQAFLMKKYRDQKLSSSSVHKIFNILNGALKQAKKNRIISNNPAEGVELPKLKQKEVRILSHEEQDKFIEALKDEKLKILFLVSLTSGLRIGEICALKWSDLDMDNGSISVNHTLSRVKNYDDPENGKTKVIIHDPKTESSKRNVPLPDITVAILKQHEESQSAEIGKRRTDNKVYDNQGFVFATSKGTPIDKRNAMRAFHRILEKAGIPKSNVHSLRHTYASRLLESGANIKLISELLGHSDPTMLLKTYSHVLEDQKKEAVQTLNQCFKMN